MFFDDVKMHSEKNYSLTLAGDFIAYGNQEPYFLSKTLTTFFYLDAKESSKEKIKAAEKWLKIPADG